MSGMQKLFTTFFDREDMQPSVCSCVVQETTNQQREAAINKIGDRGTLFSRGFVQAIEVFLGWKRRQVGGYLPQRKAGFSAFVQRVTSRQRWRQQSNGKPEFCLGVRGSMLPIALAFTLSVKSAEEPPIPIAPTMLLAMASATITLRWDYPIEDLQNDSPDFRVYWSDNVALPMTNWVLMVTTKMPSVKVTVIPGLNFFAVNASNMWGLSFFSNITNTPGLVKTNIPISITRP